MKFNFLLLFVLISGWSLAQSPSIGPSSSKGIWLRADVAGMIPKNNKMFELGWEHRAIFPAQTVVWSAGWGWYNEYNIGPIAHIQADELRRKRVIGAEYRQYLYNRTNRTGPFMGMQFQRYSNVLHTRLRDTVFPQLGYFFDTTTVRIEHVMQLRLGYKWMDRKEQWMIEPSIGLGFIDQTHGEYYTIFRYLNFPSSITRFRLCVSRKF
jgi:hypothetical protein